MEIGKGLYLRPYRSGSGLCLKKKISDVLEKIPDRPLTNIELTKYIKELKIPNFRGIFMRNALPLAPKHTECAIVNLDDLQGPGTHWVAYKKSGNNVMYFDSFGNLKPPTDLMNYFNVDEVKYNYRRYQDFGTHICGHLCLKFLAGVI